MVIGGLIGATAAMIYFNSQSSALTVSSSSSTGSPSASSTPSSSSSTSSSLTPDPLNAQIQQFVNSQGGDSSQGGS